MDRDKVLPSPINYWVPGLGGDLRNISPGRIYIVSGALGTNIVNKDSGHIMGIWIYWISTTIEIRFVLLLLLLRHKFMHPEQDQT